jgi:hypothetical protein
MTTRTASQSKISDSFRSGAKGTKPLKKSISADQPVTKSSPAAAPEKTEENHLVLKDPKLVSAARSIEADRKAPFGIFLGRKD